MSSAGDEAFIDGGALSRVLDGYRARDGQRAMARDVAALIESGGVLACEAGTGTGKTLAYLVPVLASGRGAIVSTGTRNLQEQLHFRDLPLACEALGVRARVALLKGRGNYLCLHRLHAFAADGRFADRRVPAHLAVIGEWAARTGSGDRAELDRVPEDSPAWRYATSTRDNCLGAACAWFDDCHLYAARRLAAQADVVVVNHHLLLAQLALEAEGAGELLPDPPVLVVDEAHQLPDLATEFFGATLSSGQILELARDADLARRTEALELAGLSALAAEAERGALEFRLALGEGGPTRVAWAGVRARAGVDAGLDLLGGALGALADGLGEAAPRGRALAACAERARALATRVETLRDAADDEHLSWLDLGGRGFTWRLSPLDVGPLLGPRLAARHDSVLLTSATLAVAGDLGHFTTRVGLPDSGERIYDSPFDFARQTLLYLPRGMPEPRSEDYARRVHECAEQVLDASGGRAFVLFTSHRALDLARTGLAPRLAHPVLVQGDAPRARLLERFRELGDAVLLGTYGFWEGVDVRGEALSCVIIDKLPFAPPDDPLLAARHAALRARGVDPFVHQQVPQAAIQLKQGVGRLIRDARDRGVVVVCDPRLHTRGYGRRLLASLPPMPVTRDLANVEEFFRAADGGGYTAPQRARATHPIPDST